MPLLTGSGQAPGYSRQRLYTITGSRLPRLDGALTQGPACWRSEGPTIRPTPAARSTGTLATPPPGWASGRTRSVADAAGSSLLNQAAQGEGRDHAADAAAADRDPAPTLPNDSHVLGVPVPARSSEIAFRASTWRSRPVHNQIHNGTVPPVVTVRRLRHVVVDLTWGTGIAVLLGRR